MNLGARRACGFTLLEILVAFIVLALVGGALLQLFQGGLRNVTHAHDYTYAALLARSKLAELNAQAAVPLGEETGEFDDHFRWQSLATAYVDEEDESASNDAITPVKVRLTVLWGEAEDERSYSVDTLFLSMEPEDHRR